MHKVRDLIIDAMVPHRYVAGEAVDIGTWPTLLYVAAGVISIGLSNAGTGRKVELYHVGAGEFCGMGQLFIEPDCSLVAVGDCEVRTISATRLAQTPFVELAAEVRVLLAGLLSREWSVTAIALKEKAAQLEAA